MPNPDQVAIESKRKKNMEKEMHQGKSKQNKVQIAHLFDLCVCLWIISLKARFLHVFDIHALLMKH